MTTSLTGTATLTRFALRRDRVKLPAWVLGITAFVGYYAAALPELFPTQAELQSATAFVEGPIGAILGGPGYGFDDLTIERFLVGQYGLYFLLGVALMNLLRISRHTRVEEQEGRTELVRAAVVGRHAQLASALIIAVIADVAVTVLAGLVLVGAGFDAEGSWLFAASIGACGLAFAGVAAVTAQVTEYSRAASGMAGAVLGVAFLIRAVGDVLGEHGSPLSWLSPLAWSQQTRAFVDERWWPLLLSLAFAAAMVAVAVALSSRRDVGAGLVAARAGRPRAASWLGTPIGLAVRLQRGAMVGWGVALLVAGVLYGVLTDQVTAGFEGLSEEVLAMFGGDTGQLVTGYLSVMALFNALLAATFAILSVQNLWAEERTGRAEPVLATATSRWAWAGGYLAVTGVAVLGLMVIAGAGTALGAAAVTGDAALGVDVLTAHLVQVPGVLVITGAAVLLVGVQPRAVGAAWALVGWGLIVAFFGDLLELPTWLRDLSPLDHAPQLPLEPFTATPVVVLVVVAGALAAGGLIAYRRRDLVTV